MQVYLVTSLNVNENDAYTVCVAATYEIARSFMRTLPDEDEDGDILMHCITEWDVVEE